MLQQNRLKEPRFHGRQRLRNGAFSNRGPDTRRSCFRVGGGGAGGIPHAFTIPEMGSNVQNPPVQPVNSPATPVAEVPSDPRTAAIGPVQTPAPAVSAKSIVSRTSAGFH